MNARWWSLAGVGVVMAGAFAVAQTPPAKWVQPTEPFRIADDLYYVGSAGLSSFLIRTPQGLILVDAGLPANAPAFEQSIRKLGLRVSDIKILLNTHAHADHAGGLAQLKRDSGALLVASEGDRWSLEHGKALGSEDVAYLGFPPVKVDRVVREGGTVSLGGVVLTARLTPGHTRGCTSWELPVMVGGVKRRALIYCSTSVAANRLAGPKGPQYPGITADYEHTFAKLRGMRADMFLAPHPEMFAMEEKRKRIAAGGANPFVDPTELARYVTRSEQEYRAALARQEGGADAAR